MVIKADQLVVKHFDDTPVMAWVKKLTDRPGEVAVVCFAPPGCNPEFPEGFEFESDLESLEVVHEGCPVNDYADHRDMQPSC